MQTLNIQLTVSGIQCPKCVKKIKETLDSTAGITNTIVDLESKTVKLSYDTSNLLAFRLKILSKLSPAKILL